MSEPVMSVATFASLDDMNREALEVFEKKKEELRSYNATIQEAETLLKSLTQTLEEKQAKLAELSKDSGDIFAVRRLLEQEATQISEEGEASIRELTEKHKEEIEELKADFEQILQGTSLWAQQHASVAITDKQSRLSEARKLAQETKQRFDEISFIKPMKKRNDESRKSVANQIAQLESQISEITALTREELRESRAKIDECVAAVEIRQKEQAAEVKRLEDELQKRKEHYDAHVEALKEQFELEKSTVEQAIESAKKKSEKTQTIIKQLEEHHDTQLNEVLADMETMRKSVTDAKKMTEENTSLREIARKIKELEMEKRALIDETRIVKNEISELEDENALLKRELQNLNNKLYLNK